MSQNLDKVQGYVFKVSSGYHLRLLQASGYGLCGLDVFQLSVYELSTEQRLGHLSSSHQGLGAQAQWSAAFGVS